MKKAKILWSVLFLITSHVWSSASASASSDICKSILNKTAFVTGASSGVGNSLVKELHSRGYIVHFCARRVERVNELMDELNAIRPGSAFAHYGDVTKEADLIAIRESIESLGHQADLVVANAGVGVAGTVDETSFEDFQNIFDVNAWSVVRTYQVFSDHLKNTQGAFGVMGSVHSYLSGPRGASYSMSKFAVRAFADALRPEVAPLGVGVSFFSLGSIATEITRASEKGLLPSWMVMKPEKAALLIANGLEARKPSVVVTNHAKVLIWFERVFPSVSRAVKSKFKKD